MENTSEFLGKSCSQLCAGWGLKNNGIVVAKVKSSSIFCGLGLLFVDDALSVNSMNKPNIEVKIFHKNACKRIKQL